MCLSLLWGSRGEGEFNLSTLPYCEHRDLMSISLHSSGRFRMWMTFEGSEVDISSTFYGERGTEPSFAPTECDAPFLTVPEMRISPFDWGCGMQAVTTVPAPTVFTSAPQTIIAGGYAPQVITAGAPPVYTQVTS
jgi:hypothetical protein